MKGLLLIPGAIAGARAAVIGQESGSWYFAALCVLLHLTCEKRRNFTHVQGIQAMQFKPGGMHPASYTVTQNLFHC